jgi:hypothetical protein
MWTLQDFLVLVQDVMELIDAIPAIGQLGLTLVMAIATVAIALLTYRTWRVYVQMAAIMRRAQRQEWMPLVELRRSGGGTLGALHWTTYKVTNVGRGYALEVAVVYRSAAGAVRLLDKGHLAPGEDHELKVEHTGMASPIETEDSAIEVTFKDVFDNEFRVTRSSTGLHYRLYE